MAMAKVLVSVLPACSVLLLPASATAVRRRRAASGGSRRRWWQGEGRRGRGKCRHKHTHGGSLPSHRRSPVDRPADSTHTLVGRSVQTVGVKSDAGGSRLCRSQSMEENNLEVILASTLSNHFLFLGYWPSSVGMRLYTSSSLGEEVWAPTLGE